MRALTRGELSALTQLSNSAWSGIGLRERLENDGMDLGESGKRLGRLRRCLRRE